MQRLDGEGGGVAVFVAILLVPLIGFAAIAIDAGALHAERRQLQNGADAAALAIAQACAGGNCGDTTATANTFAGANANDGAAAAEPVVEGNNVRVETTTLQASDGRGALTHWFAPILGVDETTVRATSSAAWGNPSGGTAIVPLIISWCSFVEQTGGGLPSGTTEHTINLAKHDGTDCTGPSGLPAPAGFGYLKTDAGVCDTSSSLTQDETPSDPGNSTPSTCSVGDIGDIQNETVLLPIFEEAGGTGTNAWYRVYGYAAFRFTGYFLGSHYQWNTPCGGEQRCIRGYFTDFVEVGDAFDFDSDAPDLGASVVRFNG